VSIGNFFRKKQDSAESNPPAPAKKANRFAPQPARTTVRIDFEMMLKGSIYDRPTGRVRQFGVTVDGATRVVTSGDFVNRETYDALLKAGAIRPRAENAPPDAPPVPPRKNQR
jgi:hypothetical protein